MIESTISPNFKYWATFKQTSTLPSR